MGLRLFALGLVATCVAAAVLATKAHADPCKAIPDKGPAPAWLHRGASFSGPVPYVGDGDSLCIDVGGFHPFAPKGETWVEVRLADFYAPELHDPDGPAAKAALERVVRGRTLICVADHRSYDRMVAVCRINDQSVGELLRAAGVREGGRAWRGAK